MQEGHRRVIGRYGTCEHLMRAARVPRYAHAGLCPVVRNDTHRHALCSVVRNDTHHHTYYDYAHHAAVRRLAPPLVVGVAVACLLQQPVDLLAPGVSIV